MIDDIKNDIGISEEEVISLKREYSKLDFIADYTINNNKLQPMGTFTGRSELN